MMALFDAHLSFAVAPVYWLYKAAGFMFWSSSSSGTAAKSAGTSSSTTATYTSASNSTLISSNHVLPSDAVLGGGTNNYTFCMHKVGIEL